MEQYDTGLEDSATVGEEMTPANRCFEYTRRKDVRQVAAQARRHTSAARYIAGFLLFASACLSTCKDEL
jgi:hypothetical protein